VNNSQGFIHDLVRIKKKVHSSSSLRGSMFIFQLDHDRSFNYEKHYQSDNRSTSEPPVNRKNHSFIDESESNIMQELRV